eukprot:8092-Heterococcus_DN1.PRE.1
MDLKNNKKRQGQAQAQERGLRLKRWLGTVKSAQGGLSHDTTLRVSWSDLTGEESKGRWWKVGAAWVGNLKEGEQSTSTSTKTSSSGTTAAPGDE